MHKTGEPKDRLDLVFLAEGYTASQQEKFQADAQRMTQFMFEHEPFRKHRGKMNVSGVFRASWESGVDEPDKRVYRNSVLNASFNSLGIDRYLLAEDGHALKRYAAQVPYDTVVVLVNSKRYGGGAICLDYCVTTVDDPRSEAVFLHEFAHSLAYLADEYIGAVTYSDIYPEGVEPVEPNITRELELEKIKWSSLVTQGVPLPTPKDFSVLNPVQLPVVGAFEGGGYLRTGMYRPQRSCAMGDGLEPFRFCVVCDRAIERMIEYYAPSESSPSESK
ncbi:MAG: M64 family metallo-endopeptidase [Planctomycetota bacterium]|nr:M64 family metallo-endopeptidase [Planctomycetota bacterium]